MVRFIAAAALVLSGCIVESEEDRSNTTSAAQATSPQPTPQTPRLRLEVNLGERQLYVFQDEQPISTHPVAVGSKEWPTPTGEWTVKQVIFNPRWVPPQNEEWAEDEDTAEPGDPDNPLGVVQLVYNAPNSIHGTNEPESLGKAVSHGSIRVSNEVGIQLAKAVLEAGGAPKDDAWVQNVLSNRTQREEIVLPNPVPVRVIAGDSAGNADTTRSR